MSKEQAQNYLNELNSYYRKGEPKVTDLEFDILFDEYRKKFPDDDFIDKLLLGEKGKVKLPVPMASLDKLKTIQDVIDWVNKVGNDFYYVITPKYDGISSCVTVKSGKITQCLTRGDGEFGQDVTRHFLKTNTVGSFDSDGYFIGEMIMRKNIFADKYSDKFANPRNMTAGLFNKNEPTFQLCDVDFVPYIHISLDRSNIDKSSQLAVLGLPSDYKKGFYVKGNDINEDLLNQLFQKFSIEYEIDGLVIDVDPVEERTLLGIETNGNPAYSKAIKLESWRQVKESSVIFVELNVSKQGLIKPVIVIEPTHLSGVTIERITGYNYRYICENYIHPGALISITRSGDVIPKHLATVNFNKLIFKDFIESKYSKCPSCNSLLKIEEVDAVCENINCKGKLISSLVSFFNTIGIEEVGEPTIKKFIDAGFNSAVKILSMTIQDIASIDGMGELSGNKILKQFDAIKKDGVSLSKILHALGYFDGIGEKKFDNLISYLPEQPVDIFDFSNSILNKMTTDMLLSIPGVSSKTISNLMVGIEKIADENSYISSLIKLIPIKQKQMNIEGFLSGKTFCFTGFRDNTRVELIRKNGGIYSDSIKTTTQYLVVKDKSKPSSKLQLAKKRGVQVISIDDLDMMMLF